MKRRNKEIDNVIERIDEMTFRHAGQFNRLETEVLNNLFNNGRNDDMYERSHKPGDDASFYDFLDEAQHFDDRIKIME